MHKTKQGDGNPIASITREITKSQLNTILLLKWILPPKLPLEVRQFEAERLTWLNFSLIEVRRESSSFCHLTHRNTKMFAPSPSSSVCSTVLSVQVITFEYRYGRQDHGTFGYRIPRLWICKNNTPPTGLSSLRLLWLHFQSFSRKLTQSGSL